MNQTPRTFRDLHTQGCFVMPNPWDVGSATRLAARGFPALATTSSGLAWSLGKDDQQVTRDELVRHVAAIVDAVDVPINVDAERCYPDEPGGVERTAQLLVDAGAAGFSIEDYNPDTARIEPVAEAAARVAAVVSVAQPHGVLVTARAENHLYDAAPLDDTLSRLRAYRAAGADVLYAPGITADADFAAVVEIGAPVNALLLGELTVSALAGLGVRRISTGGALAKDAYATLSQAADRLRM